MKCWQDSDGQWGSGLFWTLIVCAKTFAMFFKTYFMSYRTNNVMSRFEMTRGEKMMTDLTFLGQIC